MAPLAGGQKEPRIVDGDDRAALIVQGGPQSGSAIRLSSGTIKLGRQNDNDVVLDDDAVSREHAVILEADDGYYLLDLGSTNGTFVNRHRLGKERSLLRHGDVIHIGASSNAFRFHHAGATTRKIAVAQSLSEAVVVDPRARQVYVWGERLEPPVARKEFDLLMLLDSRRGEAISRDDIATNVWHDRPDGDVGNHEIEQCVRRVRVRIEEDPSEPQYLVTVRGFGYKLN